MNISVLLGSGSESTFQSIDIVSNLSPPYVRVHRKAYILESFSHNHGASCEKDKPSVALCFRHPSLHAKRKIECMS